MNIKEFGERIQKARIYLNYKQLEFAKKIGMSSGSLSNAENGNRFPPFDAFISICEEFEANSLSTEWLLTGKGNMLKDKIEKYQELTNREIDLLYNFRKVDEYVQAKLIGRAELLAEQQAESSNKEQNKGSM